jgi:hypothetical protein
MYQLTEYQKTIKRLSDGAFIPLDPGNVDYRQFKADLAAGASLEDATGTAMTPDQIAAFVATLP